MFSVVVVEPDPTKPGRIVDTKNDFTKAVHRVFDMRLAYKDAMISVFRHHREDRSDMLWLIVSIPGQEIIHLTPLPHMTAPDGFAWVPIKNVIPGDLIYDSGLSDTIKVTHVEELTDGWFLLDMRYGDDRRDAKVKADLPVLVEMW